MMSPCIFLVLVAVISTEALSCSLPPPSKEDFGLFRRPIIWYEKYRYSHPMLDANGPMIVNVTPFGDENGVNVDASYPRNKLLSLHGTGEIVGNQLSVQYEGLFGLIVSGKRNIVYTDNKCIYIDHFCLLDIEVSTIFYCEPEIPPEELEKIWEIVDRSTEVDRSRYKKIT